MEAMTMAVTMAVIETTTPAATWALLKHAAMAVTMMAVTTMVIEITISVA